MQKLPEINKIYHHFDDGKIKISRRYNVVIKEIIAFNDISAEMKEIWQQEVESCNWLYNKETDYFIKGILLLPDGGTEEIIFVRTRDYDWFSLGFWSGTLDVSGELNKLGLVI